MGQKGGDGSRIPDQQVIRKEETLAEIGVSGALDGKTVARFRWALGTSPGPLALAGPRTGGEISKPSAGETRRLGGQRSDPTSRKRGV